jgi:hypothetical protein
VASRTDEQTGIPLEYVAENGVRGQAFRVSFAEVLRAWMSCCEPCRSGPVPEVPALQTAPLKAVEGPAPTHPNDPSPAADGSGKRVPEFEAKTDPQKPVEGPHDPSPAEDGSGKPSLEVARQSTSTSTSRGTTATTTTTTTTTTTHPMAAVSLGAEVGKDGTVSLSLGIANIPPEVLGGIVAGAVVVVLVATVVGALLYARKRRRSARRTAGKRETAESLQMTRREKKEEEDVESGSFHSTPEYESPEKRVDSAI